MSAKLERSLEGIREMVLTDGLPSNGGLLELLFGAVQAVYRVSLPFFFSCVINLNIDRTTFEVLINLIFL